MQINIGQPNPNRDNSPQQGGTFIDWNNMKRERIMLDRDGNEIDPKTKQIIKRNDDPSA